MESFIENVLGGLADALENHQNGWWPRVGFTGDEIRGSLLKENFVVLIDVIKAFERRAQVGASPAGLHRPLQDHRARRVQRLDAAHVNRQRFVQGRRSEIADSLVDCGDAIAKGPAPVHNEARCAVTRDREPSATHRCQSLTVNLMTRDAETMPTLPNARQATLSSSYDVIKLITHRHSPTLHVKDN